MSQVKGHFVQYLLYEHTQRHTHITDRLLNTATKLKYEKVTQLN